MFHHSNRRSLWLWMDPLMNCVLPLDSSAREPRSGSRRTIEECLHWSRHMPPLTDIKEALPLLYLEIGEGGEAAGRAPRV